jgi:plasmid stabilization system protein ParE
MSKRRYELTAAARLDLLQIWNYLAEHESIDVADKIVGDIEKGIEHVTRSPQHGHQRTDLTDRDLLFYLVHSYFVIYRPTTDPLWITRILHTSRDVKRLLK